MLPPLRLRQFLRSETPGAGTLPGATCASRGASSSQAPTVYLLYYYTCSVKGGPDFKVFARGEEKPIAMSMGQCQSRAERHNCRLACEGVKEDGASPTVWIPAVAVNLEMPLPCLPASVTQYTCKWSSRKYHHINRLHDAKMQRCFESIKAEASAASPRTQAGTRARGGPANSRKNRSHVIPTLIPTLLIEEGRAARGSGIKDPDRRRSLPQRGSAHLPIYTTYVPCTLCSWSNSSAVYEYSGLLFGTGQRIGCLAGSRNESKKQKSSEEDGGPRR